VTAPTPPSVVSPPTSKLWAGATWPVPIWLGETPEISDGFSRVVQKDPKTGKTLHRQHLGVDICYRNKRKMKTMLPTNTDWYHMASDVPMLAALSGTIWLAEDTERGLTVEIDHGNRYGFPLLSYYTHMSALLVKKGDNIVAGMPIGIIGNDPSTPYDQNHCHFELWDFSRGVRPRSERCIDPTPYLAVWPKVAKARTGSGQIGNV
jgi:murein DD-endopeptidase MepM/ murein hydrolase activator NlpD